MIELAFNESLAGALKYAKSMKPGQKTTGSAGIIGGSKKDLREAKKPQYWPGADMEGSSSDVEALTLALDMGDISDIDADPARTKQLSVLYGDFPGVPEEIGKTNAHAINRLRETQVTFEPIRAWICESSPADLCGLYFLCYLTREFRTPLFIVRTPATIEKDDCVISYHSSGEIEPSDLGALCEGVEAVSATMHRFYAGAFLDLMKENAPLRAIVNGTLLSVPESFYDFALYAHMPEGEFVMARLIGNALLHTPGVSDRWLFLRIEHMIQTGELAFVSPATDDHPYSAMLKRV
jgi:hypothetical protein